MIPPRRRFGPVAGPPAKRVLVPDAERFVVPPTISQPDAERIARERIQEGVARPADSHLAEIESAHLVWIPMWRVEAVVDVPTLGARDVVRLLPARSALPVDPSERVTIAHRELQTFRGEDPREGEWIEADVARDEAESAGCASLRRLAGPFAARVSVRVRGASLVHLAVWLRRYRYEGEASGARVTEGHVALDGRDGAVASERHPSAWRALAGRARRALRRG